ncbi:MAG: hypothetical protein AB8B80_02735 [Marinicellaceae bacterium]
MNTTKLAIAIAMVGTMGLAQSDELTALQAKVLSDHTAMQEMSAVERKSFRKQIFNNSNKQERIAYNSTYKSMHQAGMLPKLAKVSSTAVANRAPGTNITYDDGNASGVNNGQPAFGFGNRFNSAFNPTAGASGAINPVGVGGAGSVTMLTFSLAVDNDSGAFVTIGTNIQGTAANSPLVTNTTGLAVGMNMVTVSAVPFSGEFLGAVWQAGGGSGSDDVLGVSTGTVDGQGFHALSFDDSPVTGIVDVANQNAIFRVSGTNLVDDSVPVELMNFSVE